MTDYTVKVWKHSMSMKTFKPIVRLMVFKVALDENEVMPMNFESRYLAATMKNVKLSDEFNSEFKYGLKEKVVSEIKRQLGNSLKNSCLVTVGLYPGVEYIFDSISPSIKRGIVCDYEVPTFSTALT